MSLFKILRTGCIMTKRNVGLENLAEDQNHCASYLPLCSLTGLSGEVDTNTNMQMFDGIFHIHICITVGEEVYKTVLNL